MADITAIEQCEFCEGTLVAIKKISEGEYMVQREDCGCITSSHCIVRHNNNSKMKKVRKLKRRYHD